MTGSHILVVDDEPAIRFFLQEMLERDGHKVVTADSGEKALEYIAAWEFDLALIDLKMEGVSGLDVLAALRRISPDTVVIVLTGHASLETAVEVLRHGAHDYLFKPCKSVELRESVQRGLLKREQALQQRQLALQLEQAQREMVVPPARPSASETAGVQARFLRHGGLIVDLLRHVITLDGVLLELSPTEFDILAYMIDKAPRVLSPQELVREVQGYESNSIEASELIRYHIYRLRKKIKQATRRSDVIRTVRGVGYAIAE